MMRRHSPSVNLQYKRVQDTLCLSQNEKSVTSISSAYFVPQPLPFRMHFVQNRIFVGNIPLDAEKMEIMQLFRQFGPITAANVIEEVEGKIAFVTYTNIESANAVLSLYNRGRPFILHGHEMKISRAYFKPKKLSRNDHAFIYGTNNAPPPLPPVPTTDVHGGICYNGTVYYNQPNPVLMESYIQPNNLTSNLQRMQQTFQYTPVYQPPPAQQPPALPMMAYPMVQQLYQNYNINNSINIRNVISQGGSNMSLARISEYDDSGYASLQEWSSIDDVNQSGQTVGNQEARLSFIWCNNDSCLPNTNDWC